MHAHHTWVSDEKFGQDKTSIPCPQPSSATLDRSTRLEKSDRTMFYRGNSVSRDERSRLGIRFPIMSDKRRQWWKNGAGDPINSLGIQSMIRTREGHTPVCSWL